MVSYRILFRCVVTDLTDKISCLINFHKKDIMSRKLFFYSTFRNQSTKNITQANLIRTSSSRADPGNFRLEFTRNYAKLPVFLGKNFPGTGFTEESSR